MRDVCYYMLLKWRVFENHLKKIIFLVKSIYKRCSRSYERLENNPTGVRDRESSDGYELHSVLNRNYVDVNIDE